MANPFFANLLFDLFDAAELDARGALRFFGRHAGANVFVGQQCQMGANFFVEVYIHTTTGKKVAQYAASFCRERHGRTSYVVSNACAMAQEMRPHRRVSASSCFRPALVRR